MSRSHVIRRVLSDHFEMVVGMVVSIPEPPTWQRWQAEAGTLGPSAPLGWGAPVEELDESGDPTGRLILPFCPEVIDEQTVSMSDHELAMYLHIIMWTSSQQVIIWDEMGGQADAAWEVIYGRIGAANSEAKQILDTMLAKTETDSRNEGVPMESRTEFIKSTLDNHFIYQTDVMVATPDRASWEESLEAALFGPTRFLGWGSPLWSDERSSLIVPFCPEIIDEQTAHLDGPTLNRYLEVIRRVVDRQVDLFPDLGHNATLMGEEGLKILDKWPEGKALYDEIATKAPVPDQVWTSFDNQFADLVETLDMPEFIDDVLLPSEMDNYELVRAYEEVRERLLVMGEMAYFNPSTQEARDLHSERSALLMELKRRNLH